MVGAAGDIVETCFDVRTCPLEREPADPLARNSGRATASHEPHADEHEVGKRHVRSAGEIHLCPFLVMIVDGAFMTARTEAAIS